MEHNKKCIVNLRKKLLDKITIDTEKYGKPL